MSGHASDSREPNNHARRLLELAGFMVHGRRFIMARLNCTALCHGECERSRSGAVMLRRGHIKGPQVARNGATGRSAARQRLAYNRAVARRRLHATREYQIATE